jgi:hypothetical protein
MSARVRKSQQMTLRPPTIRTSPTSSSPVRLGLAAALAGTVALGLAFFAGPAAAGAGSYPSPLYLSGGASALVGTSFQLVGGPPAAVPATPTAALNGAGVLTGSYAYLYTVDSGAGAFTASATSTSVGPASQQIQVANLPTGVTVDIYRQKGATGLFYRVADLAPNGSSTYTDNLSDAAAAANPVLPQADNRIATTFSSTCAATTCGYLDFSPGVAPATTAALTPPTLAVSPSATPDNKGWLVDGAGGVTFPAGTWTFQVRTKNSNPNGVAHLVVGVWKVTTSGGAVASSTVILAPNCTGVGTPAGCPASAENGTNIVTAAASVQTIAAPFSLPAISLAAGEHLYVQFWRRQTTPYSTGGTGNRLATMIAYDGLAQITHPAADSFPNDPALQTPADLARTSSSTLAATFSDPDAGDTGTVAFQVCADSACSSVVASGSSPSVANGASASWTPGSLVDGAYYWRGQATDAAGAQSSWTATRSFTLDRTAPSSPSLQSPANGVLLNALPALAALFSDPDAGDTGTVSFRVCTDSGCSTVSGSGSASGVANGASASWTPASLADGAYYWQAQAADAAGNPSSWTATRSFTLDTTAPDTTISAAPASPSTTSAASFSFGATEAGSTFQCSLDGAAFAACTSPASYSGLADGSHSFQVEATDPAGNTDPTPASSTWTIDTTPPDTTIGAGPANPSNSSAPSFSFSGTDNVTPSGSLSFKCSLDGAAFTACTSPTSYSGLAVFTHTTHSLSTDAAGNPDPTPASSSWTIDTAAPNTTIGAGPASLSNTSAPSFSFSASKAGSSFQCSLDGAAFTDCTSPTSYSGLADGSHSFQVEATDPAGNTDPTPAGASWTIDTAAPDTTLSAAPASPSTSSAASFTFTASKAGSTFQCSLDGAAFTACTSPRSYSGLADGSHNVQVKATDAAGNTDPTPASASWTIDTTAPETTLSGGPASPTNSTTATFSFSASESGSSFQCSLDGAAFAACSSPAAYSSLADGSHSVQVKATDPAGNTDPSPARSSWTIDTTPPYAPALSVPIDQAWTNSLPRLAAVFSDPNGGSTGTVTFRLCSDSECANVLATASSSAVTKGATADWTVGTALADGTYYWQARARDAADNQSSWTATRSFTLDRVAPGAPDGFVGVVAGGGLTLRWSPPANDGPMRNYVLYVDGVRSPVLDGTTLEVKLGKVNADDGRAFAVAAVDEAGNEGPRTETLVGVPNLIGLKISEAAAALAARGLVIGGETKAAAQAGPVIVVAQTPAAPAVAFTRSPVAVVVADQTTPQAGPRLILATSDRDVSCAPNGHLSLTLRLSTTATVTVRFLSARGGPLASRVLGSVRAGATSRDLRLPPSLSRPGVYRVVVTAIAKTQVARADVRLSLTKSRSQSLSRAPACRSN